MKTQVTNTINGEVQQFDNLELAQAHVQSEIAWWNSPNENKNGNGYNDDDFIIERVKFVIYDNTDNSGKPYIAEDLRNTGDPHSAWMFDTQADAKKAINDSIFQWASVEEIYCPL